MKNKDTPAFPISVSTGEPSIICSSDFDYGEGLTKREFIAAIALNGILACSLTSTKDAVTLAKNAILATDALLKELESND